MLMVGMAGWVFNAIVFSILGWYPGAIFTLILPAAVVVGAAISSRITRAIGRALPPISTTATRAVALVGMRGTVISPFVDKKYGQVHVRNLDGTLITIFAVNDGVEMIKRGDKVLLVSYDAGKRQYLVASSMAE
jgi:membrane protein implicated in regulation of membrane protease activity